MLMIKVFVASCVYNSKSLRVLFRRVLPPARRFLAGSAAGVTAVAITYPLDMVRARLAVSRREKYVFCFSPTSFLRFNLSILLLHIISVYFRA